jgi:ATP-binding cassette, subfamily B (MDR/TAP), member 9
MRASAVVFIVSSLLQAATTTVCALWPLAPSFTTASVLAAFATYTPGNSNVDVWCLTLLNITILAALVWFAATGKPSRQGFGFRPHARQRHTRAIKGVRCTALCFQLLLLTKAVTVAIVGSDQALPTKQGNPGLILIYVATVVALVTSFAQSPAAQAIVRRWKASAEATAAALLEDESSRSSESSSVEATGPGGLATPLLLSNVEKAKDVSSQEPRQATIGALLRLSAADTPILLLAFTAGAVAALGQALVPYFTGRIVDYASIDPDPAAFRRTTVKLLGVAAACALFTGIRGGLFTIAMTRLNMRLRHRLFASLLRQDPGFYDVTKTGEISSRLSADTTTVSDQICLNLNVMLRSATQAAMVLGFMFTASWRLTVVTFVMVPLVLAICKVCVCLLSMIVKCIESIAGIAVDLHF